MWVWSENSGRARSSLVRSTLRGRRARWSSGILYIKANVVSVCLSVLENRWTSVSLSFQATSRPVIWIFENHRHTFLRTACHSFPIPDHIPSDRVSSAVVGGPWCHVSKNSPESRRSSFSLPFLPASQPIVWDVWEPWPAYPWESGMLFWRFLLCAWVRNRTFLAMLAFLGRYLLAAPHELFPTTMAFFCCYLFPAMATTECYQFA